MPKNWGAQANNTTLIGNDEIDGFIGILQSHGLIIPNWVIIILVILIVTATLLGHIGTIYNAIINLKFIFFYKHDQALKQFIGSSLISVGSQASLYTNSY